MPNALDTINLKLDALSAKVSQIPAPGPTPAQLSETSDKVDAIAAKVEVLVNPPT